MNATALLLANLLVAFAAGAWIMWLRVQTRNTKDEVNRICSRLEDVFRLCHELRADLGHSYYASTGGKGLCAVVDDLYRQVNRMEGELSDTRRDLSDARRRIDHAH